MLHVIRKSVARFLEVNLPFFLVLSPLFLIVNGFLLLYLGVSLDDDSQRYLSYATEISERGLFFKPHDFWYVGYPLFILLMKMVHPSLEMVIIGQVVLSYCALFGLYKTAETLFSDNKSGLIAGLLFLMCVMVSFWNFWILCESLLISLNSLFFSLFVFWQVKRRRRYLVFGLIVFLAAFFTKPTGIAVLAGLLAIFLLRLCHQISKRQIRIAVIGGSLIGFFMVLNQMLLTFGFLEDYQTGEIVYNIHKLADQPYAEYLMIKPPIDLYLPPDYFPVLIKFFLVVVGNPVYSFQLIVSKLFYYLLYVRPYFSIYHNGLALMFLIPLYYAFIAEMRSNLLPFEIPLFVAVFLAISILSSILLTVDWNSRFLAAVLPLVFVLASRQIIVLLSKKTWLNVHQMPKV